MLSILVGMASHVQNIQNNKFVKFLQISQEKWGMKLIFYADENQSFQQVDAIIFDGHGKACLKYSS